MSKAEEAKMFRQYNIVNKLMTYTGETNKYMKVLSGAAKNEYLEFEKFMIEGPESP